MFKSWKLGRIAGIDLFLHPTFLFLLLFAYSTENGGLLAALFTCAVFGCVLLHEFGHALTARAFGIGTRRITLYPIGGVAQLDCMPRSPGAELLVTLAGPAVNVALAATFWLALKVGTINDPYAAGSTIGQFVRLLMNVNLMLAAFNMIPAFPMDGGRVFRALLTGWVGRMRATEIAASLGQTLAMAFPVIMILRGDFSILHVFLAAFVYFAAAAERASVRAEQFFRPMNVNPAGVSSEGVNFAPAGYRWVTRGAGVWQLVPE